MSTAAADTTHWMSPEGMRNLGFPRTGPEVDYGTGWGHNHSIRVSYSPYAGADDGFLYAYNKISDRYLLLAAHTTPAAVEAAWRQLNAGTPAPEAYLAFAALDQQPLPYEQARSLLLHCVGREFAAYRDFTSVGVDGQLRVDAAHTVVVQRSARVSAEQILIDSARAESIEAPPVIVRYRVPDEKGWVGQVAGTDLGSAVYAMRSVHELALGRGMAVQATSVAQGRVNAAAARVPELDFARGRTSPTLSSPLIDL